MYDIIAGIDYEKLKKVIEESVLGGIGRNSQEQATYEGIRFIGTDLFTSLSNGSTKYYFVDFSSVTKLIEFYDFNLSVDGQAIVHVYKNPDISDKGTEISIMNANVKSEIANQLKIYADPTINSNGTEIMKTYVASGSRGDRVMKEVFSYRILGEDMLIGIENVSGNNMSYGSVIFDWKEVG